MLLVLCETIRRKSCIVCLFDSWRAIREAALRFSGDVRYGPDLTCVQLQKTEGGFQSSNHSIRLKSDLLELLGGTLSSSFLFLKACIEIMFFRFFPHCNCKALDLLFLKHKTPQLRWRSVKFFQYFRNCYFHVSLVLNASISFTFVNNAMLSIPASQTMVENEMSAERGDRLNDDSFARYPFILPHVCSYNFDFLD